MWYRSRLFAQGLTLSCLVTSAVIEYLDPPARPKADPAAYDPVAHRHATADKPQ